MAELTHQAGLVPPEFDTVAGEFFVRFLPTGYVPPTRVGHDLSPLQRDILAVLSQVESAALGLILSMLQVDAAARTVRENLAMLRVLGLVDSRGRGRSARWSLTRVGS